MSPLRRPSTSRGVESAELPTPLQETEGKEPDKL